MCEMLGEQTPLSCSHHGSLHVPRFIVISHRSPKNLKLTKFHPKLRQVCLQSLTDGTCHPPFSDSSWNMCILYANEESSICLGSGNCCRLYEASPLGSRASAGLDW